MKNKILKLVAFCVCITLLIFVPAIITLTQETYLNITMSKTGRLPVVKTYEKLEELVGKRNVQTYNYGGIKTTTSFRDVVENSVSFDSISSSVDSAGSINPNNIINQGYSNSAFMGAADTAPSQSASDYSSTNTQVQGVDEADRLKNDGKYIYTISADEVVIVDAFPASTMKKVSEISFKDGYRPVDLYISGDRLFVITDNLRESPYGDYYSINNYVVTKVFIYDIIDRSVPKEIKTFEVTGRYTSSRMIGEKVYVFTNLNASRTNDGISIPQYRENAVSNFIEVKLDEIQYVPNDNYTSYTQIIAYDLAEPLNSPKMVTYLGSSASDVYMSHENLYMAQNRYSETVVYKFSLDSIYPRFEAKGSVPGSIVNQFAMDEYDGNFRIATTKNRRSAVYILGESMHKLGSVTNIAPNEDIKSVRFEGNRGYVVTFRNTDPLFVIDLSNVRKPKILGELKIPGYSTYLHTYDENHVIGFGYDGTMNGTNGKLKIALFDITDVKNPKEKFVEKIDARNSELLENHKSLLFSKDKNLIAFAVGKYYNSNDIGKVYTITLDKGFELRGEITHENADVRRMLYMDENLYGVSESVVSAHNINNVELIKQINIK